MKTRFPLLAAALVIALVLLCIGAVDIQWYSQQPNLGAIQDTDIGVFERQSPHAYGSFSGAQLKAFVGSTINGGSISNFIQTNIFQTFNVITNISETTYATNFYSSNAFITNLVSNFITVNAPGGFTNLNLTPNSVMKSDANDAEASIANAFGVLTNDGVGGLGFNDSLQFVEIDTSIMIVTNPPILNLILSTNLAGTNVDFAPGAGITFTTNGQQTVISSGGTSFADLPVVTPGTDITVTTNAGGTQTNYTVSVGPSVARVNANNVWVNTSSNFNDNAVWTDATNANNTTPDFAIRTSTLSTNNNFTWLLPTHLDTTGKSEQWIKTIVTNSLGTLITMTAPAGCHVCGAGANNVTNWTEVLWQYYPPSGPTNYWPIPGY